MVAAARRRPRIQERSATAPNALRPGPTRQAWPDPNRPGRRGAARPPIATTGAARRLVPSARLELDVRDSTAPPPRQTAARSRALRADPRQSAAASPGPAALRAAQAQAPARHGPFDSGDVESRDVLPPRWGEAIQVPGRPPRWTWFPGRFEHITVGKSDQDGIERTRLQVDFCGQVVAVAPPRRIFSQRLEDSDHLRRRTPGAAHKNNSTYVVISVKRRRRVSARDARVNHARVEILRWFYMSMVV